MATSGFTGLDQIVARGHRDEYDLEEKGESVAVRYTSATHSALQNQISAANLPPSTVCLSTSKVVPRLGTLPPGLVPPSCGGLQNTTVEGVCRMTLRVSRVLSNHRNCP